MTTYTSSSKSLTVIDLAAMKQAGEKISCLTAYDASFAGILDKAGIDIILVGDSLGMVIQGHTTTVPVTVDDMLYHSKSVALSAKRALILADLPFASYVTPEQAIANAARLMQFGGAQMIKLEGAKIEVISHLAAQGIPVCGHLGLLPQSVNRLGGFKVQGRDSAQAQHIINDAMSIQEAGADLLVLECIPALLASRITQQLRIPVIGIGAGVECDGQVLVLYDMLGISQGVNPRFSKNFLAESDGIESAVKNYHQAVKNLQFPGIEHSY